MELNEIDFVKDVLCVPDRYDHFAEALEVMVKDYYKSSRSIIFRGYRLEETSVRTFASVSNCSCCYPDQEEDNFPIEEVIKMMYTLGAFDV
ncbi:hypothetical protein AHP1_3111 [Aeromonas phage Ahp1_CNU-2021]|nr:hypothetical protein AHP1_3111 [Aeromonas phage Ahp1_CNU-2021]